MVGATPLYFSFCHLILSLSFFPSSRLLVRGRSLLPEVETDSMQTIYAVGLRAA